MAAAQHSSATASLTNMGSQLAAMGQDAIRHTTKLVADTVPLAADLPLWKDIVLAPMDGVTDLPMRLWLGLTSAPLAAITPFLRITDDFPVHRMPAMYCPPGEETLGMSVRPQIMGSCPKALGRFVHHLLKTHAVVDINMGCPAPKVVGNMGGSGLIRCQKALRTFLERLFDNLPPGRVSIKTRLGFDDPSEAQDLLGLLGSFPLSEITLHGRTRAQKYRGQCDWSHIGQLAQQQTVAMAGSGDIVSAHSLGLAATRAPHVQRFLIGRGLLRNPWLGHEIRSGRAQVLDPKVLAAALRTFVTINNIVLSAHYDSNDPAATLEILFQRLSELRLSEKSSVEELYWQEAEALLEEGWAPHRSAVHLGTLGRLKMLWNYVYTSLPSRFASPAILRSRSYDEFFSELERAHNQHPEASDGRNLPFLIQACSSWDWKFSGEGRRKETDPLDEVPQ